MQDRASQKSSTSDFVANSAAYLPLISDGYGNAAMLGVVGLDVEPTYLTTASHSPETASNDTAEHNLASPPKPKYCNRTRPSLQPRSSDISYSNQLHHTDVVADRMDDDSDTLAITVSIYGGLLGNEFGTVNPLYRSRNASRTSALSRT
jgi:hypothetical protein